MTSTLNALSGLGVIIALTIWAYWPGLSGPFLFDDFANLPPLADFGGVRDLDSLRLYLLNGFAGPTGRPLALLSFLVDDFSWPSDPRGFKTTNLCLHLLVGLTLLWVVYRIALLQGRPESNSYWTALAVTGIWLLHPLNVSTTLYVVQRMAILSAQFTLLGILAYLHGREQLLRRPLRAYVWMSLGVTLGTALAILSKENGAVLPTLILILESFCLSRTDVPKPNTIWKLIFLVAPTLGLLGYLAWVGFHESYFAGRSFTVGERILTQGRVLCDYLYHWFNPWAETRGLFTENYPISTSLANPLTTLTSIAFLATLSILSVLYSAQLPNLALGVLFFLGGHLVESTTIPLEIYFEHRNYLPAMLLILPAAEVIVTHYRKIKLLPILVAVLALGLGFATHRQALFWSDNLRLATHWVNSNPDSPRAQSQAATAFDRSGQPDIALAILTRSIQRNPANLHLRLHYLLQKCFTSGLSLAEYQRHLDDIRTMPFDVKAYPLLDSLLETLPNPSCRTLDFPQLHALLNALSNNSSATDSGAKRQIHHLRGMLHARQKEGSLALFEFRQSLAYRPNQNIGLLEVAWLASSGLYEEALSLLDTVASLPPPELPRRAELGSLDYPEEIARLRQTLLEDLERQRNSAPTK